MSTDKKPDPAFLEKIEFDVIPWISKMIKKEEEHLDFMRANNVKMGLIDFASELEDMKNLYEARFYQYNEYLAVNKYGFTEWYFLSKILQYTGPFDIKQILKFFKENYKLFAVVQTFGDERVYPRYVVEIRDLNDYMSGVNNALKTIQTDYEDQLKDSFEEEQDAWIEAIRLMVKHFQEKFYA